MKLLLDTHIFVWNLLEPRRLAPRVAGALEDPSNELWLSPIVVWEILVLAEKGRLTLRPDPDVALGHLPIGPLRQNPALTKPAGPGSAR